MPPSEVRHPGFQFVRFCAVGVVNTALDFLIYFILTRYIGFTAGLIFSAKAISYLLATVNSFFLNRHWTFEIHGAVKWHTVLLFFITVGSGIFINVGVHFIDVKMLALNDLLSTLIAAALTAVWGFLWSKYLVFR